MYDVIWCVNHPCVRYGIWQTNSDILVQIPETIRDKSPFVLCLICCNGLNSTVTIIIVLLFIYIVLIGQDKPFDVMLVASITLWWITLPYIQVYMYSQSKHYSTNQHDLRADLYKISLIKIMAHHKNNCQAIRAWTSITCKSSDKPIIDVSMCI